MAFSLDIRCHSEIGLVRRNNQDSGYVSPRMLVVADGMGGAAAGDLASTVAVRHVAKADRISSHGTPPLKGWERPSVARCSLVPSLASFTSATPVAICCVKAG